MFRIFVAAMMFAAIGGGASAQVYNPNINPVPALPPPPTPPIAVPHLEPVPPVIGADSASLPARAPQLRLGRPSPPSFGDRAVNCIHQGGAIGVPAGAMGAYTRECANSE